MRTINFIILFFLITLLTSCLGTPANITAVENFHLPRYLGTWYEIARLPHSFEKDLQNVTAHYQLRKAGGISVINRGYNPQKKQWKTAKGKAFFVKSEKTGHLKVSFFGPFYASYIIFYLDNDYQNAMVTSHNKKYFWLLSRTRTLNQTQKKSLINAVKQKGFALDKIIWVKQSYNISNQ